MKIGDRIAQRRKELGLTQDQLAEKMGYKSKAAISKIETNVNDITQSTIVKFAEVLNTSVAYLMGWEDESGNITGLVVEPVQKWTEADMRLLQWFRSLPPGKQKAILISQDAPEGLL